MTQNEIIAEYLVHVGKELIKQRYYYYAALLTFKQALETTNTSPKQTELIEIIKSITEYYDEKDRYLQQSKEHYRKLAKDEMIFTKRWVSLYFRSLFAQPMHKIEKRIKTELSSLEERIINYALRK